ncbi:MAG: hypothetical protein ACYC6N_32230 [Pirellulaceae bacterium]
MWRRIAIILTLGLSLAPRAQAFGQAPPRSDPLIVELNWVSFDVVMGRIRATGHRARQARQRVCREQEQGATEAMTVTLDRGLVSICYESVTEARQLTIRVIRRDVVEIESKRRESASTSITARFTQPSFGDVCLTVHIEGQIPMEYRSPSLWHLLLTYPEICQAHLNDALRMLRPNWQIEQEVAEIRAQLRNCDPQRQVTSRREVELLVEQMAHEDFSVRQRAARELRVRGRSVLGFLQEMDSSALDAEQRLRMRSVQEAIIAGVEDTSPRVVAWLVNDKSTWLALLDEEAPGHRDQARCHLARLCGRAIEFDPQGDRETRAVQIASLRTALLR